MKKCAFVEYYNAAAATAAQLQMHTYVTYDDDDYCPPALEKKMHRF